MHPMLHYYQVSIKSHENFSVILESHVLLIFLYPTGLDCKNSSLQCVQHHLFDFLIKASSAYVWEDNKGQFMQEMTHGFIMLRYVFSDSIQVGEISD